MTNDRLRFRYSGFLQNVDIRIHPEQDGDRYVVSCTADLKLPILKKQYETQTIFKDEGLEWVSHAPVTEKGRTLGTVERAQFPQEAVDPIGFFLKLHRGEWNSESVTLVIGAKAVRLQVLKHTYGFEIIRPEREQKLIVRTGSDGIEALEVPVRVLGSLKVARVE